MTMLGFAIRSQDRLKNWAEDGRRFWLQRNQRWSLYRRMIAQTYKMGIIGYENVISNEPRVQHDRAVNIIAGKPPIIRMPMTIQDAEQRQKMSESERLAYGMLEEVSGRWQRRMHQDWLRDLEYYICLGSYCVFPRVSVEGKEVQFRADIWDPIQVYPTFGEEGLIRIVRAYTTPRNHAIDMAQANGWNAALIDTSHSGKDAHEQVPIINAFWVEDGAVMNAVTIDGFLMKEEDESRLFRSIPVIFGNARGVPFRDYEEAGMPQSGYKEFWQAQSGQAVFDAHVRSTMDKDRILTYAMANAARYAKAPLKITVDSGIMPFTEEDIRRGEALPLQIGEDVEYVSPPPQPRENLDLIGHFSAEEQRAALAHVSFGELPGRIAAITLKRLNDLTRNSLTPYVQATEQALSDVLTQLFDQYKRGNFPKVSLTSKERAEGASLNYIVEDYTREQIPETVRFIIKMPLDLPDERLSLYATVKQIMPGPEPLLSRQTAMEEFLDVQDPALEEDKITRGIVHTEVRREAGRLRALRELRDEAIAAGRDEDAENLDRLLQAEILAKEGGVEGALPPEQRPRQGEASPAAGGGGGTLTSEARQAFGRSGATGVPAETDLAGRLRRIGLEPGR